MDCADIQPLVTAFRRGLAATSCILGYGFSREMLIFVCRLRNMPRRRFPYLSLLLVLALACERGPEDFAPPQIGAVHVTAGYTTVDFAVEADGAFSECGIWFGESPERLHPVAGTRTADGFTVRVEDLGEGVEYCWQAFVGNGRTELASAPGRVKTEVYPFVRIPDPAFKAWCVAHYDANGDREISPQEAREVTDISCPEGVGARNLRGIEAFTALHSLTWEHDLLEEVDLSRNTRLAGLWLRGNNLREIDLSNNLRLEYIGLEYNELRSLDLGALSNLRSAAVGFQPLAELRLPRESRLEDLGCQKAELRELDLSDSPQLLELVCNDNCLTSLDLSACRRLRRLYCWMNDLIRLDFAGLGGLEDLRCAQNDFSREGLDLSACPQLRILYCNEDRLETLDVSGNPLLKELGCYDNPNFGPVLDLRCQTRLDSLDVRNSPRLEEIRLRAGHVVSRGIVKDDHTRIVTE